jgi:hypothetical protein
MILIGTCWRVQPLPVPTRNWGSVNMNLITALPETASGNTAIVVFDDRLTEMVHLAACKTAIETLAFAKMLRHEVIRGYMEYPMSL